MGAGHRYELIKEGGGGDIKDEPQHTTRAPFITSWWKFLLCNLLAASAGVAVMFLIDRTSVGNHFSSSNTAAGVATSTTLPTDLPLPTASVEQGKAETETIDPGILPGQILDCGWSTAEARAKGCVYDVMMQDWVPEPCYDGALTETYLAEGNWTWYADSDGKKIIPMEEMRKGEHGSAWMATSYHHAHCVFSWVKLVGALRDGRGITEELLSNHHVMHCSHGALKESPDDQGLGVRAPTNYAKCALFETWKSDFSQMNIP